MPIVTAAVAAIAAVGSAVAAGAGAAAIGTAVAVAAVNVGTLVGVVGLGMSVIGMATGNKTLSKIGGYLGMAGGVMSLAGGLAGGLSGAMKNISSAWDDGVGSLFSSTKPVGQEALNAGALQEKLGRSIVDNSLAQQAAAAKTATTMPPTSPAQSFGTLGPRPQVLPPPSASVSATPSNINPLDFAGTAKGGAVGPDMAATQFANAAPKTAPLGTEGLLSTTAQANQAPAIGMEGLRQQALGEGIVKATQAGMQNVGGGGGGGGTGSFFSSLPDWAKAQVAISGAQGLAGMAGGWFEGATAEEKLALEREAQQWRMQHEDSIKNFNQRNASYAPRVTFGGNGMLSKGATT